MSTLLDLQRRSIHVLIVDDSAVARHVISSQLSGVEDITVAVAANPMIAMQKMARKRPDVIILDLQMPYMDGMMFLRKLMREDPLPVIICSGYAPAGSDAAILALDEGAVEVVSKPMIERTRSTEESTRPLIDAVRAAALADVRRGFALRRRMATVETVLPRTAPSQTERGASRVIAIGGSTGGPDALRVILQGMPSDCPGIVIVQHISEAFTSSLARWIGKDSPIAVREARAGDEVERGTALVARGNYHLVVKNNSGRLVVDVIGGPLVTLHRPSVDVLFRSVAQEVGAEAIGILLSGMGKDGAMGLREMKDAGAWTIAQNEDSCVVYGMPRQAVACGGVVDVMSPAGIARALSLAVSEEQAAMRAS